jgi:hypothetical protein
MPGIAELQPVQIQANSVGAVTNPNVDTSSLGVLPEFKDFMDAYRQGVITAEDIRKREIVGTTGYEAERAQNVAAKSGAEQMNLDVNEIRPIQRELAKATAQGGVEQQTLLNQMNSQDPNIALPAQEAFHKRQDQLAAIKVFGTATPKLEINAEVKPEPFDEWVNRQANAFQGTPDARAVYETQLRLAGEKGDEYQSAVSAAKSRTRNLEPGTPEYDLELSRRVDKSLTLSQHRAIQLEALKEFSKAQGKAAGEAPAEAVKNQTAAAKDLRTSFNGVKEIDDFAKVNSAYSGILALTDPTIPSSPLRDQGVIYQWMKLLDPSSTVREGEYASVKNARGVPEKIRNWWNQTLSGEILTPGQRKELREAAAPVWQSHVPASRIKQYTELERSAGLSPGTVVPIEYRAAVEATTQPVPSTAARVGSQAPRPTVEDQNAAPTVATPADAQNLPPTVQFFKDPNGVLRVNPNYTP